MGQNGCAELSYSISCAYTVYGDNANHNSVCTQWGKMDVLSSAIVSPVHILSMVIMPTITQFAPNVAKLDVLSSAIVSPLRTLSMVIMPTIICLEVSGHPVFYLGEALGDNLISVALPWVRASQGTHTFTRVCGSDKPGGGGGGGTHTFIHLSVWVGQARGHPYIHLSVWVGQARGHPYIHLSVWVGQARGPIHSPECVGRTSQGTHTFTRDEWVGQARGPIHSPEMSGSDKSGDLYIHQR